MSQQPFGDSLQQNKNIRVLGLQDVIFFGFAHAIFQHH
jgi:hypothetical protein